ncbi:MAG: helix-turn-helix domain-containing protein [Solirubrobacteraceae bacterium]
MKFPANSPAIPSAVIPSRAVAHSSLVARRPARRSVSAVTGTSSLAPAVGWRVRAEIVERERILRGWTRAQLTEAADIDPKTLRDLLNGRRHPTLGTVGTLCRALDVPLADVVAIIEQPRPAGRVTRVGGGAGPEAAQALLALE